jgi:hypothetical protein
MPNCDGVGIIERQKTRLGYNIYVTRRLDLPEVSRLKRSGRGWISVFTSRSFAYPQRTTYRPAADIGNIGHHTELQVLNSE